MTVTEEQIAELREGDIVRIRHRAWPKGVYQQGPLFRFAGDLSCGSVSVWGWAAHLESLEVIERKPRFYANADRDPVVGDVAHTRDSFKGQPIIRFGPWFFTKAGWISTNGRPIGGYMPATDNVLLVDGATRKVMPRYEEQHVEGEEW